MANIPNNKMLLPNMLAEVSITDMNVEKGMVIPSKSILKDQNNRDFIFVARDEKVVDGNKTYTADQVYVVIIERFEGEALIETNSELDENDKVVIDGARGISDKTPIRVEKEEKEETE